jgi:hypothetical protein
MLLLVNIIITIILLIIRKSKVVWHWHLTRGQILSYECYRYRLMSLCENGVPMYGYARVRTKLESPWMSLNLKTKIQGLECPWICKQVLECPWILLALVFGYFLKLFDIQDGHFVELILHVHIWPHYKVTFWTIQRQILLICNTFFFSI